MRHVCNVLMVINLLSYDNKIFLSFLMVITIESQPFIPDR